MSNTDAMDFYNRVTDSDEDTSQYTLQHTSNAEVTVDLTTVDRTTLLDEINRLPDAMLETLSEAEDEDEAQDLAEERNMLSNVDGNTVIAFENICAESIEHEQWTSHHVDDIVQELSFEVLFEMGSTIIENSFEETGSIEDFHEVASDKSS